MKAGYIPGWSLGPPSANWSFRPPEEGFGAISGPSLMFMVPSRPNVDLSESDDVSAAAAERRAELVRALMKRAQESSADPRSTRAGPWAALPGIATAFASLLGVKR